MNIAQILKLPLGTAVHDLDTIAKKAGKSWEGQDGWWQSLTIWDESGEMPADVFMGGYHRVIKGEKIKIIEALVQSADDKKCDLKLSIEKFERETQIGEPEPFLATDSDKVIRSKIECLLAAGFIKGIATRQLTTAETVRRLERFVTDPRLAKIIDEIVRG